MPAPKTIKFTAPAAGDHEVAFPDFEKYLSLEEVAASHMPKEAFQTELERRVTGITKDLRKPDDLVKDPDFLKRMAKERRDDLIKELGITQTPGAPDIAKIRDEIAAAINTETVTPLKAQVAAGVQEIDILRVRDLDGQIVAAQAANRAVPGLQDLITLYVRGRSAWDPDRKQWFIKKEGGEGFEFSTDANKNGHPFMTPKEYVARLVKDPEKKSWFETGTQEGPGYTGVKGDPRAMTLTAYNALSAADKTQFGVDNPVEFARIMQEIATAGENKLFK